MIDLRCLCVGQGADHRAGACFLTCNRSDEGCHLERGRDEDFLDLELLEFFKTLKIEGYSQDDLGELADYLDTLDDRGIPKKYFQEEGEEDPLEANPEESEEQEEEEKEPDLRTLIGTLNLPQKLKLALFGNALARSILIHDGNRLIQLTVLKNPKLQDKEIDLFTKNPQISKHVIRLITDRRKWIKPYHIKHNIVTNPKTPIDLAIQFLRHINESDLKKIARSKSVASAVVTQAKRKLTIIEERKKGKY